jgi:hypothetical protein
MAWAKLGTTTLGSAGTNIEVTYSTANKFNQTLTHSLISTTVSMTKTFNNDSGSNYANRYSENGGADATTTSQSFILSGTPSGNHDFFNVCYFINIATEEKLFIAFAMDLTASGATSAPTRREIVAKWVNTSDSITTIDENGSNNFDTDSNLSAIGTD